MLFIHLTLHYLQHFHSFIFFIALSIFLSITIFSNTLHPIARSGLARGLKSYVFSVIDYKVQYVFDNKPQIIANIVTYVDKPYRHDTTFF